ncbi:hypothetical protein ScalyP_jg656 [Parmales sp. scaly parma]|nr:hypothetical protein ScalyP_jg656 [Parmales sp. scaly parma]
MGSRLSQKKKGDSAPLAARDFADWKKKNHVSGDTRVFSMTGWYPCVKDALISRGWFFDSDRDSPFFDLKCSLLSLDVKNADLESWQLTNHFVKNTAVATKNGIHGSLSSLTWVAKEDVDSIFPRCYDLSFPAETGNLPKLPTGSRVLVFCSSSGFWCARSRAGTTTSLTRSARCSRS